jgi:hypothetical protein
MTIYAQKRQAAGSSAARIFGDFRFGPRIALDKEDGTGSGGGEGGEGATGDKTDDKTEDKAKTGGEEKQPKVSDKEAELLKEVMDKKAKLKEAQDAAAAAAAKLKEFEGIDPVEVKKLLQDRKDAEKKELEAKGDFDRLKAMMAEEHKKELEKVTTTVTEKDSALAAALREIDELTIGSAFSTSKFVTDELVLTPSKTRQVYGSHFERENGQIVAYDKPKGAAERTKLVDGSGNPLGFEAALKKLVEIDPDHDRLVRSKTKDGAGSKTEDTKTTQKTDNGLRGSARIAAALAAAKAAGK